ncbi:MAG TPA: carbohydrate-binding family 9-like protein [Polyangiaceae bacterium]|nr:carbohydrate-binding family 9-like protein [Polyangiaceae bacterium]
MRWLRSSPLVALARARFAVPLWASLALGGCAKKAPPALPAGLELPAPPADMSLQLGLEFGGVVELLGAKVSPTQGLKPGSRVDMTLYWRPKASVPRGFTLFTHILDEAGERILNLDTTGPLRKTRGGDTLYPPSSWQVGKVYADQVAFWVPASLRTDSISVVCGLFAGDERLALTAGSQTGERARVIKLQVQRPFAASSGAIPTIWIPRRLPEAPLAIDGKLDDASWTRAASIGSLVNVTTGEAPHPSELGGSVKLLYDEQALYVGFEVFDYDLRGGFDPAQTDPHLWTRDTVEIMIDPDGEGDNRDYYELQVGPQNLVFDSAFDSYNSPKVEPDGPFGHQEWSSKVQSAVVLNGTLDDDKEDEGYVVEMAIPWASFDKAKRVPPLPDDMWRMNFYAMQNNGGVAWSPILGQGNFHKASRFGRVRFVGPTKRPLPGAGGARRPSAPK